MTDHDSDPYDHLGQFDYYGWLAAAPPTQLGPAIAHMMRAITRLTVADQDRLNTAYRDAYNADPDRHCDAADRAEEAYDEHPIGNSSSCVRITDVRPWVEAVRLRIGLGMSEVLMAVALRDHDLIDAADFEELTGWWVRASQTVPDPIGDADLAALREWWAVDGIKVPERSPAM